MQQALALNLLKSGKNIFLTGQAGSGKTYVINQYVQRLWSCGIHVALTASTGIAATHIGGVTIHSWSGIGIKEILSDHDLELLQQKEHLHKNITKAQVLIIDEISMLSAATIDAIDTVVKMIRRDGRPFGGLQVIFVGDFFQLPPVMKAFPDGSESPKRFAFAAQAWKELDLALCYLETQYRQRAGTFGSLLQSLRKGTLTEEDFALLRTRMHEPEVGGHPVKLYTHNVDVDRLNMLELEKLQDEAYFFRAVGTGDQHLVTTLKKSLLAPEELVLKVGAKVLFVKNNPQKGYVNGSTGEIVKFDSYDGYPIVVLADGREIKAEPEMWSIENADTIIASVKQIPLKLAWAITIHKSQGMTLDAAEVDLSKVFEPGQGYVALSRVRSLEGLCLRGINEQGMRAHQLVLRADAYFLEQSGLLEQQRSALSTNDRITIHTRFVTMLGGTYVTEAISSEKTEKKQAGSRGKIVKGESVKQTMLLVADGKTLAEIVQLRGLTESTILEHIFKIHTLYPDVSLQKFAPPAALIQKVTKVRAALPAGEPVKLKALFDALGGKLSYEQIKLCLLFV